MTNKEKDILALFNELNSMLYEVLNDYNKALSENIELKKVIERYRNDPNVMFEPTDEKVTKTFMDIQVDPKDIEFEAEMLVKCVQDYADSLKNKSNFSGSVSSPGITGMNLKEDESDLKYFCASTGKWNDMELMKQDPEILALKDTKPKLKSLKQHNDSKLTNVFGVNSKNSGFACPICTSELIYTNPNLMLTSHPPKREVRCSNCKHIDYVY